MRSTEDPKPGTLPVGVAATMAIICEVTAAKPGNVHRGADFEDVTYFDFVHSAVVVGPIVGRAAELGVGRAVLDAVQATRAAVGTNTNLGTLLLLAPLATVADGTSHRAAIGRALLELTFDDTRNVFEAIRLSAAGGLGRAEEADVAEEPPAGLSLVEAMRMASERDLVARQYCNEFADVFRIADWIEEGDTRGWSHDTAIVHAYMRQLASETDSLIVRKCGAQIGEQARAMARCIVEAALPGGDEYERGLADLDFWLRADGHRRNPGTTADLIAAALFVLLREGRLKLKR
jgi:triphosphoribosyl-dephospho-CoA synthase